MANISARVRQSNRRYRLGLAKAALERQARLQYPGTRVNYTYSPSLRTWRRLVVWPTRQPVADPPPVQGTWQPFPYYAGRRFFRRSVHAAVQSAAIQQSVARASALALLARAMRRRASLNVIRKYRLRSRRRPAYLDL